MVSFLLLNNVECKKKNAILNIIHIVLVYVNISKHEQNTSKIYKQTNYEFKVYRICTQ